MSNASRSPVRLSAALALLAWTGAARAQAVDPFAPHVRWVETPAPGAPWLPRSVAFAEAGELVLGAGSVGAPQALALSSADLAGAQLVGTLPLPGALGTVQVTAGPGADALYVLSQHAVSGPTERATRVTRASALGGALSETWSAEVGPLGNGAARLFVSRDGLRVVSAVENAGAVALEWLDPAGGASLGATVVTGGTLRELAGSDDGARLALLAGPELWVLDAAGAALHHEVLAQVTNALALSGDGATLVVGDGQAARVLVDAGGGFAPHASAAGAAGEVLVRAALSGDGARMALGWWDQVAGTRARFQVRDAAGGLLHELVQLPGPAGLQNYPEAVAITPDGRRAAYGAWGVGDAQPELMLVDVDSAALVLAVDLPGSLRALALSDDGTRVAVGAKHAHANQFAATGELELHDTGERELQVLARATPAGELHLSSLRAGATRALFLVGTPLAAPGPFRGAGLLFLDRAGPLRVKGALPDATGRADATFSVPALLQGLGADFAAQAAWRVGGRLVFGPLVDPLVL